MDEEQTVFEQLILNDFNKWREFYSIKGALSSLRQFLETKSLLKTMKNAFYFALKALLVLMIFNFFS